MENEQQIDTLVRYAGQGLTILILDVAKEQLKRNEYLTEEEKANFKQIIECCDAWLE